MTSIDEKRKCVYCLKEKRFVLGKDKSLSEFNVEHVIHHAFGTADSVNPTLVGRVCKECNDAFSGTIDIAITKDSFEAFMRVPHNLKDASEMTGKTSRRLSVKYTDPTGAEHKLAVDPAALTSGSPIGARPVIELKLKEQDSIEKVDEAQIASASREDLLAKYDFATAKIIGTEQDGQRIINLFKTKGIVKGAREQTATALQNARQEIVVDATLQRAFAKIAFNYMVFCSEKLCPDLPYLECFNPARSFIRYGTEPGGYRVANPWPWPQLNPMPAEFQHSGHFLMLEYGKDVDTNQLLVVGKVSLFKEYAVMVTLTRNFNAKFCRIDGGHFSDLTEKKLIKLTEQTIEALHGMGL